MPHPPNACWERLLPGIGVNPVQTGFVFNAGLFRLLCDLPCLTFSGGQRSPKKGREQVRGVSKHRLSSLCCKNKSTYMSLIRGLTGVPSVLLSVYGEGALSKCFISVSPLLGAGRQVTH